MDSFAKLMVDRFEEIAGEATRARIARALTKFELNVAVLCFGEPIVVQRGTSVRFDLAPTPHDQQAWLVPIV